MMENQILTEDLLITVIANQTDPRNFFENDAERFPTTELLKLVIASPEADGKFIVSSIVDEEEVFFGINNATYQTSDFEYIQPSLSFDEIFRLFASEKQVQEFVDEIEADSDADYWMLYRCEITEKNNTLFFVPLGRFKRTEI